MRGSFCYLLLVGPSVVELREVTRRILGLPRWLLIEPWKFWAALLVPFVALALSWLLGGDPGFRVRLAGYLMTFAGVLLVAHGIWETQRLFNRPRLAHRAQAWLKRFPLTAQRRVTGVVGMALGCASVAGSLTVRKVAKDSSLEARVDALEENLRHIETRVSATEQRFLNELQKVNESLASERSERERGDHTLRDRLERFSAGGLDFELMGVVWLIVGQLFASFPDEVGNFLSALL